MIRLWFLSSASVAALMAGCAGSDTPAEPRSDNMLLHSNHHASIGADSNHQATNGADQGNIMGWFEGETVSLRYSKWYFCAEPPQSGSGSNCVLGAEPEVAPRPGRIPFIYAVAAVGFQADPTTLSCPPGSLCINHPAMIDASRVVGPGAVNVPGLPHSHIVDERQAGWHQTVNIRVFSPAVWSEIVAAKSLERVRQLQADPEIGGKGLISPDTPTNIFFFLEVQRERP